MFSLVKKRTYSSLREHANSPHVASVLSALAGKNRPTVGGLSTLPATGVADNAGRPIYLDMQATTPTDPRVLDFMLPFMTGQYGNPHSSTHQYGWETKEAVETAREHVANLIGADSREIVFTSGATESNNMVIKGVPRFYQKNKNHIITTQTEHKCVIESCRHLEGEKFVKTRRNDDGSEDFEIGKYDVTYLPVQSNGLIDLAQLEAAIRPETVLVSIMYVNNEIGVVQPVDEIGAICRKNKVFFHTDAAQAFGKIPIDVDRSKIDLMSISGHKVYGPKGVGACYVRNRPRPRLEAIMNGGGQERGRRSGTVPAPLACGFGEAARIAKNEMAYDLEHVTRLSNRLKDSLLSIPETVLNGEPSRTYPGCVNISFAYVEGESLLMALKNIALSSGSACTSASLEPSYVLHALGADDVLAHSSIRFGIGRFTTDEEIDFVIDTVSSKVEYLRNLSPLWEMVQEGIDLNSIQWSQH